MQLSKWKEITISIFNSVAFIKTSVSRNFEYAASHRIAPSNCPITIFYFRIISFIHPSSSLRSLISPHFSTFPAKVTRNRRRKTTADDPVDRDENHVFLSVIAQRLFSLINRFSPLSKIPRARVNPLFFRLLSSNTPFSGRMANRRLVLVESKLELLALFIFPIVHGF